ncbi:hypothetical protein FQN49_007005 [Arthroderma sp. PD_2]|nr:hypothetical protein FQN49_007005 [Arthroderma sp. PD_2]
MASNLPVNGHLVNIGTHSLALYSHGPEPSSSRDPVVLFISGIASDAESSPLTPTAENVALELSLLIEKASISNPLILVGHSWAGVLTHEYIALKGTDQLAGLVLVDANHETAPLVMNVNDPVLWTVIAADLEPYSAWGVEAAHKLTPQEWNAFREAEATEKFQLIMQREEENYVSSFERLREKELGKKQPLLGERPVYVIAGTRSRDWSGLYRAGVARGNGTEEERSYVREMIETVDAKNEGLMREFLKLSRKSELVFATESGHFVQLTQPEVVADGVNWALHNIPR